MLGKFLSTARTAFKPGEASNLACRKIAGVLLDIHAGWRCEFPKLRYIKHGLSERLAVSKVISIYLFSFLFSSFIFISFLIILFYIFQYSLATVYSELEFRFYWLCNF